MNRFLEQIYTDISASDTIPNIKHINERPPYKNMSVVHKVAFLIEQFIYVDYIALLTGSLRQQLKDTNGIYTGVVDASSLPLILSDYRQSLVNESLVLLSNIPNDKSIYNEACSIVRNIAIGKYPTASELHNILIYQDTSHYLSIRKEFYLPFINTINGSRIDNLMDIISGDTFYLPELYIPRYYICPDCHKLYIRLVIDDNFVFSSYKLTTLLDEETRSMPGLLYRYLANFNWSDKKFDHLIALLVNFHIENNHHVMHTGSHCPIADVCYDILMHSDYVNNCEVMDVASFIDMLKLLRTKYNLIVDDLSLMNSVLDRCGIINSDISAYLTRDPQEIVISQVEAFKRSPISLFIDERNLTKGAEETLPTIPTNDTPTEDGEVDATQPNESVPDEVSSDDSGSTVDTIDTPSPDIDTLVIELANSPTIEDVLFRQEFIARVADIEKDPTIDTNSAELLMLKQWVSRWIHLVSVNTTKEFLARLRMKVLDI